MISKTGLLFAMALIVWPFAVDANDTMVTRGAGGLIPLKSTEIAMESEELQISVHQITVKYVFRNNSDHAVNATVAFPLPAISGAGIYHEPTDLPSKDPVNFVDFRVRVAGQTVTPAVDVRAYMDGRDVTERVRSARLPVSVADPQWQTVVKKLPSSTRKRLLDQHLIECEEVGGVAGRNFHCDYWAGWETRVQYYWTQRFPAKSAIEVKHSYRPVVGGSYIVAQEKEDGSSNVRPYCGGTDAIEKIHEVKNRHPRRSEEQPVLLEKRIEYILTTANNWKGPIGNFRMMVAADSPEDIVATCMPGLKQVSPTRYELTHTSFRPDRELELLILQPAKD